MASDDGLLRAWASDVVMADCPGCGLATPAHVFTGFRGNVHGKRWLMFWRHYAACERQCVTGGIMGNVIDFHAMHRGPTNCECGDGLIDYDGPGGISLEGTGNVEKCE